MPLPNNLLRSKMTWIFNPNYAVHPRRHPKGKKNMPRKDQGRNLIKEGSGGMLRPGNRIGRLDFADFLVARRIG